SVRQDADRLPQKIHPDNPRAQRILADAMRARAACFWATECGRGCAIKANYQSPTVHLPPAFATGNLDIVTDAMVREVLVDDEGRATGVSYIDKTTGEERTVHARAVVLAASSAESIRILFNSKSPRFPDGLANSSGRLGRYIMDTVGSGLGGRLPLLENLPPLNEDGAGGPHLYIPWWLYGAQKAGKLDFPRGYHLEFGTGHSMPSVHSGWGAAGLYGRRFKEDLRRHYGASVYFGSRGEMIPNEDCYCELDPAVKDKFGLPVLRFHWKWSDYELKQVMHMQHAVAELIEAIGGKPSPINPNPLSILRPGGNVKHEVGGAMMGADPKRSVTNPWCRTWDVKNLYLCDGAPFCSNADKNPTLTIMALAWRTADHVLEEMQRGNV
ncbi:MAG TPA: GMC family oxidoreductase, partial [Opitutus sp.]|nr:GMC family oxidoreductase [Opitutus sp.]